MYRGTTINQDQMPIITPTPTPLWNSFILWNYFKFTIQNVKITNHVVRLLSCFYGQFPLHRWCNKREWSWTRLITSQLSRSPAAVLWYWTDCSNTLFSIIRYTHSFQWYYFWPSLWKGSGRKIKCISYDQAVRLRWGVSTSRGTRKGFKSRMIRI